jgi:hypothetical protein
MIVSVCGPQRIAPISTAAGVERKRACGQPFCLVLLDPIERSDRGPAGPGARLADPSPVDLNLVRGRHRLL